MNSTVGVVVLSVGFAVLIWTFVWIARLMAQSRDEGGSAAHGEETVDGVRRVRGRGYGANYGLMLGAVGCSVFFIWPSSLLLAVAAVGLFHSGRAFARGLFVFKVVLWRGLLGILLNAALPLMLYLWVSGQWQPPILDVGWGLV